MPSQSAKLTSWGPPRRPRRHSPPGRPAAWEERTRLRFLRIPIAQRKRAHTPHSGLGARAWALH